MGISDIELILRKPNENAIDEITSFKEEFIKNNSSMEGTGVLNECDEKEWLLTNKVMEVIQKSKLIAEMDFYDYEIPEEYKVIPWFNF